MTKYSTGQFRVYPIGLAAVMLVACGTAFGYPQMDQKALSCSTCHICDRPSESDPCLLPCPRPASATDSVAGVTSTPDFFLLGELSDIYVPVVFPHKLHADMEKMGQGCAVCHHNNPPGRILMCKECHAEDADPDHLGLPSLKGAYHRQCLGCHREWSHDTDCVVCHARRTPGQVIEPQADFSDIMGANHPRIEEPDTWVYRVEDMEGVVTFHHKQHVHLFGLQCVECHKEESCGRCHDEALKEARVREDPHQDCLRCHDTEDGDCEHCHQEKETKGFDHAQRSGFMLKDYHRKLACTQCHESVLQPTGLSSDCKSCHQGWEVEGFDHKVTGLALDEIHVEVDCQDCHTDGWGSATSCEGCHDDQRAYPQSSPGLIVPKSDL